MNEEYYVDTIMYLLRDKRHSDKIEILKRVIDEERKEYNDKGNIPF